MKQPTTENRNAIALELEVLADLIASGERLAIWWNNRWWGRNDADVFRFAAQMVRNPLVDVPYDNGLEKAKAMHPSGKKRDKQKPTKRPIGVRDWHIKEYSKELPYRDYYL